jgi:hypothetical protein
MSLIYHGCLSYKLKATPGIKPAHLLEQRYANTPVILLKFVINTKILMTCLKFRAELRFNSDFPDQTWTLELVFDILWFFFFLKRNL